jgi:hypothetical protein
MYQFITISALKSLELKFSKAGMSDKKMTTLFGKMW